MAGSFAASASSKAAAISRGARAAEPKIQGMQQQNQSRPAHRRELQWSWGRFGAPSPQTVIEAPQDADPQFEILVEWDDRSGADGGIRASQSEAMVTLGIGADHMAIVTVTMIGGEPLDIQWI